MSDLYFELTILLENLAKSYGVPNANYYFRVNKKKPSEQEYRKKVAEFMKHYEYTLNELAATPNSDALKSFVTDKLEKMVNEVLSGSNREVEKRYKYYIMNELWQ
ncbi:MAG: hypothetical protein ACE5KA_02210 [Nitrososphaerales archaeon]